MKCNFSRPAVVLAFSLFFPFSIASGQSISPVDLTSAPAGKACHPFFPSDIYLPNTNALWPATGDFNHDGILDVASETDQGITILFGRKNGAFQRGGNFATGAKYPGNLVVADFNHDGNLDVAVPDGQNGTVNVLLGNGDGTFQAPIKCAVHLWTGFIAVGDFNHDGELDLAAVGYQQSVVQVLFGKGDGTFQSSASYAVNIWPTSLVVADLDGDGRLDIAVANRGYDSDPGHTVSVLLGKPDGTFRPKVDFQVGFEPDDVIAADLNGDGKIDLATANYADGTVSVLTNQGHGTFSSPSSYVAGHPGAPVGLAAVSFDVGARPGLVVATLAGTFTLENNGDGTFRTAQGYEPPSASVVAADFNGDGKTDLALTGNYYRDGPTGVTVLFGRGHGVFATSAAYVAVPNLLAAAAGDFNGDGKPDLAVANLDGYQIGILLGDGHGHFSPALHYYNVPGAPTAIAVGDLNGDGKLDLAVITTDTNMVQILLGNGDGTFTPGAAMSVFGQWASWIRLADFNHDGVLDIAVTSTGDYQTQGVVSVLLGNGDGTFHAAVGYGFAQYQEGLAVGDFNHDGNLDFAVANLSAQTVTSFLGNRDGTFKEKGTYSTGVNVIDLAVADFNHDGHLDLAGAVGGGGVTLLLGNGDGSFRLGPKAPRVFNSWRLSAADFNGDGNADLAVGSGYGLLYLLMGKGDGTFSQPVSSNTGVLSRGLVVADFNGDGALDVAVPNSEGGEVSVLLNRCPGK